MNSLAHWTADAVGRLTALLLLTVLGPVLLVLLVAGRGLRLRREARVGQGGSPFDEWTLEVDEAWAPLTALGLRRWPTLLNVFNGQMALVGPRPRDGSELYAARRHAHALLSVEPGIICSWWVQSRRGINYGSELEADLEYIRHWSPRKDLVLLLQALAALVYGAGQPADTIRCQILGIWTENTSMGEAVEKVATLIDEDRSQQVCFVNADCFNIAARNEPYRNAVTKARLVFPDGVGVILASRIAGKSIRQNLNGTDMFPRLCARLAPEHRRVFLLGGKPGVGKKVKEYIEEMHPGLVVAGVHHGYFSAAEEPAVINEIRASRADLLLVAFGAPRQDTWIHDHLQELGVPVAMGVGGLFDFYSQSVPRAPGWIRSLGMEWGFRLVMEPGRLWRRYLIGNWVFMARVLREQM
jgi:N-acetylglucosaminyldiphosphoundecaprenol N-acetyl-beta-D-mannosaminyltransferase